MTDVNHDLFVKVLAQIEREPATWRQAEWRIVTDCGTAYCLAGWTCEIDPSVQWESEADTRGLGLRLRNGRMVHEQACVSLGIAPHDVEVSGLFAASNSLDDLYRISARHMGIDETVLRDKVRAEVES